VHTARRALGRTLRARFVVFAHRRPRRRRSSCSSFGPAVAIFRSRPSRPLAVGIDSIALLGAILPYTGFGSLLGFVPLPATYFLFLVLVVTAYLFAVETVKRYLFRTYFA